MQTDPWARFRYKTFISYSHADREIAERVHASLERFQTPRKLIGSWSPIGPVPGHIRPVFRDRPSLGASYSLNAALFDALNDSASLIVICSPDAAKSEAVNREIAHFKSLGRNDRIFAFIVAGSPNSGSATECFPPELRDVNPAAPDARERTGEGFDYAIMKLISGILGLDPGVLQIEQNNLLKTTIRRSKRAVVLTSALALIATASSIFAVTQMVDANKARQEAEEDRQYSNSLVERLRVACEVEALAGRSSLFELCQVLIVDLIRVELPQQSGDEQGASSFGDLRTITTKGRYLSNAGDDETAEGDLKRNHAQYLMDEKRLIGDSDALIGYFDNQALLGNILTEAGKTEEALKVLTDGPNAYNVSLTQDMNAELLSYASVVLDRKAFALRRQSRQDEAQLVVTQAIQLSDNALEIDPDLDHAQRQNFVAKWNSTLLMQDADARKERQVEICESTKVRYSEKPDHFRRAEDYAFCLIEIGRNSPDKNAAIESINKGVNVAKINIVNNPGRYDPVETASNGYYRLAAKLDHNSPERHEVLRDAMQLWVDFFQNFTAVGMNTDTILSVYFNFHQNLSADKTRRGDDIALMESLSDAFVKASQDYPEVDGYAKIAALSFVHRVAYAVEQEDHLSAFVLAETGASRCLESGILKASEEFSEYVPECLSIFAEGLKSAIEVNDLNMAESFYSRLKHNQDEHLALHPYDFYSRKSFGSANRLANAYWERDEYKAALPYLEYASYWGTKESTEKLVEYYDAKLPDPDKKDEYAQRLKAQGGMKRFTVPATFGEEKHDFHVYVLDWPESYPYKGIGGQVEWLRVARGGEIGGDIIESFEKLHQIARDNNVSFGELSTYALAAASEKDNAPLQDGDDGAP